MGNKRYEVEGMMEWHPVFKVGRSRLQVSFTGGHLCGGACTPASFTTSDPVVQTVIERSAAYKSGRIRLISPKVSDKSEVFEYSTLQELFQHLEDNYSINPEELSSMEDAQREADRLNIKLIKK